MSGIAAMASSESLSGLLLTSADDEHHVARDPFVKAVSLSSKGLIGKTRWDEFEYQSTQSLISAEEEPGKSGLYRYRIVARFSGPKLLLLADHRDVVDHLLAKVLPALYQPSLHALAI